MPRIKIPPAPLSTEDRDELLRILREAAEPLDAAKVARLAMTSRRPTLGEATAILDEFVAWGALHVWPAKTATGKPRFWDRDARSIGQTAIAELVRQSPEPVSARDVKRLGKLPFKFGDAEIASLLRDLAKDGSIHEIPAKTSQSGLRYWTHDAKEFGRRCLLRRLKDQPPQTRAKLHGAVKWLDATGLEHLIDQLVRRKEVYRHPPLGKSSHSLWSLLPPAPEPYLKAIGDQLAGVVRELQAAFVPPADLRRAAVQMLEVVGISFRAAAAEVSAGCSESAVDLVKLMQDVEPGADRGALVSARALRAAAKLPKAEFDALVLQLARQGMIALHEHDFVASLRPEDRDELVTDGQGNFYVGMALRFRQGG